MSVKQDLRTHIKLLDSKEKLHRITKSVNKDTELMPLVRWQFRGLEEEQRRGFLFENVTDSRGRTFTGSVAVGIYARSDFQGIHRAIDNIHPNDLFIGRIMMRMPSPIRG
ncbi:hypothetical protein [Paenibacillus sp.]|uniref:hypothetical protein n=1 Tax=Paenibacillus sp. TaxID=58172 RepID=UPI0035693DAA